MCRIPLTAIDLDGTLGEIAHIVAKSPNGPRGDSSLATKELDAYRNLILLCPNHHTEVDNQEGKWPVEKLHGIKASHEQWIQDQIDRGNVERLVQNGESFRKDRLDYWTQRPEAWSYAAITPLELDDGAAASRLLAMRDFVRDLRLPERFSNSKPNLHHIEVSSSGLVAEDFRSLHDRGEGYRVEIFRNGHAEIAICLEGLVNWGDHILDRYRIALANEEVSDHRLESCERLLPYSGYAELVKFQASTLASLWSDLKLPFKNMVFTLAIAGMPRLCLFVNGIAGRPAESRILSHAVVAEAPEEIDSLLTVTLDRLLNGFGFLLRSLQDADGVYETPVRLSAL